MATTIAVSFRDPRIELAHGAGGKATRRLIEGLFLSLLANPALLELADAALLDVGESRLAMTTDAFVVKPLRFPGGSIGELAVHGTVNDLAVVGARPLALSAAFILEATKVVEHGSADGMYIATTGVGLVDPRVTLGAGQVQPGDQILVSGPVGDHGVTILLARGDLDLEADLESDTRPITPLVQAVIEAAAPGLRWMRDPTRGGVASALNELARDCGYGIVLFEEAIPIREAVRGACEILGLDPLHVASEGQFLAVLAPDYAEAALAALHATPGGASAAVIGEVRPEPVRTVLALTAYGGARVVDMLVGDPLPRIC
jgi:hydrogenase expression/formation protein HypE